MTILMTPPKTFLITLPGEVDLSTQDQLTDLLGQFAATDAPSPHVDLSTVTFMDCTGLTFLVTLRRASAARGGIVTLLHPHPNVLRLLRVVQFDTVFVIISWPLFSIAAMDGHTTYASVEIRRRTRDRPGIALGLRGQRLALDVFRVAVG
jgi:anti-sigma B factor antagonist